MSIDRAFSGRNYLVPKNERNRFIVGKIRIKHLLPKEHFSKALHNGHYPMLVDKKLLYKLHELRQLLKSKNYNPNGFHIRNGFRHPRYNKKVGGASRSQHMTGKAVDLNIRDINKDGKTNKADKDIVLDLAENHIIKNEGGIGRYPNTMAVHLDTRGHRARWDKQ